MVRDILQISPASNTNSDWEGTAINRYSNTIKSPLLENDIIQLCIRTTSNTTIEFNGSINAILNLVKIF